jgi:hypothetical protein
VLKHWITNHYYDFELDNNLIHKLIQFLDEVMEPAGMVPSAEQLRKLLRKKVPIFFLFETINNKK